MQLRHVIAGVVLAVLGARPAAAESQQVRIATLAPAGSPWMEVLERAAAEIAEKTERRVTIKYYTGGQQGDERDFIRKIKLGQLDGAAVTALGLSLIEPSIRVLQLPMLLESQDEVDYVAGKMWPYFQKKFEAKGFRLGERGELGWIHLFSKAKVTSMAELRKQKLWLPGDEQLDASLLAKLKVQGVPLRIPEVDGALTTGRINACFSSPLGLIALQWFTKVKYMSTPPMLYAIGATVLSLDAEQKVSSEDRKIIAAIAKRSQKKARVYIRKANDDARKALLRRGVTVVETPKAMLDELTAIGASVQQELIGKVFSKEELAMVIAHRAEFRAKQAGRAAR